MDGRTVFRRGGRQVTRIDFTNLICKPLETITVQVSSEFRSPMRQKENLRDNMVNFIKSILSIFEYNLKLKYLIN